MTPAPPRIVANAYSTDHDVAEMLAAVKVLRRIAAQAPFAEVAAEEPTTTDTTEVEAAQAEVEAADGAEVTPAAPAETVEVNEERTEDVTEAANTVKDDAEATAPDEDKA